MADYVGDITDKGDPKTLHMNVPERTVNCPTAQSLRTGLNGIFFDNRSTAEAHGYTQDCDKCDFTGY
jgi:hypothetical protein